MTQKSPSFSEIYDLKKLPAFIIHPSIMASDLSRCHSSRVSLLNGSATPIEPINRSGAAPQSLRKTMTHDIVISHNNHLT